MKIFADEKIRRLVQKIIAFFIIYLTLVAIIIEVDVRAKLVCIIMLTLIEGCAIVGAIYSYFKQREQVMEDAISKIREYTSGQGKGEIKRIDCDDEGSTNLLFQEINNLVSILNAHIEKEQSSKEFMQNSISDISHQLKTPIAALNIYNGIIQQDGGNFETVEEFSRLLEKELDRIETLVQNLLKITKLDAGTLTMDKHQENLGEIFDYIYKHFEARAREEGKHLEFLGDEDASLYCDRTWIVEAFSNIVKNALDHTKEGDDIRVSWAKLGNLMKVEIEDTGAGIHQEDINFIFKRFYRSRFSKDTQGIGLGLPLAKSIIEMNGGMIEVDSKLGSGTVFTITFLIPTNL